MTLGQRIKLARTRLKPDVTQADVAEELEVTPQAVSGWERDADKPDIDRLLPLAALLRVNVVWLLSGTSDPPPPDDLQVLLEALPGPARTTARVVIESLAATAKAEAERERAS